MKSDVTPPQLAAVASVSLLALMVGMIAPANWLNLRLSARDVGGAIMPAGMIIDRDTSAEAMIDMAAVTPSDIVQTYGLDVHGNRELASHMEDGVKVFELETAVIRWTILPGVTVDAYAQRPSPWAKTALPAGGSRPHQRQEPFARDDDSALARTDPPEHHGWSSAHHPGAYRE